MRFRDPVCGMTVTWEEAQDFEVMASGIVYFCCAGCAARFRREHAHAASATMTQWAGNRQTCLETSGSTASCAAQALVDRSAVRDFRPLEQVPQIGGVALDTLEQRVAAEWRRQLGYAADTRCVCRTMERALLSLALVEGDRERPHEVELILAAEAVRLRTNLLDRDRVSSELSRLPAAVRTALSRTALTPLRRERTVSRVAREIPSIIRSMEYRAPDSGVARSQTASTPPGDTATRNPSPSHYCGRKRPPGRNS